MRPIDADELKKKLQEHHDFFLMAWNNSTVNMPKEDKARLDEISNCIAEVINAPTVELDESVIQEVLNKRCMTVVANEYLTALHGNNGRPQGDWIIKDEVICECSLCGYSTNYIRLLSPKRSGLNYCAYCGAKMERSEEE